MSAYLREHALLVILIVVVAAAAVYVGRGSQTAAKQSTKAPVECSIDGNFDNDQPGCISPGTTQKP